MTNPDANSAARDSAPYGKACAGCSRAKCRCIPRGPGLSCERCNRLQKDCEPSAVVRKRSARRPAPRPPRAPSAAQLSEKLDDLVTLLRAQAAVGTSDAGGSGGSEQGGASETGLRLLAGGAPDEQRQHRRDQTAASRPDSQESPSTYYLTPQTSTSPLPEEPSASQADRYLHIFRESQLRMFPFIHISPETTSSQLQREWPFLWLNIRAVCCRVLQEQVVLERKVREVAAQKLLVDLEQNMDFVLGLIVFLSWAGEKYRGKPILSVFSGLLVSLLSDLRLDRHVQEISSREVNVYRDHGFPIKHSSGNRTNDERRAALGCYIVTVCCSCFLKIPQAYKWTPYMEDCVRHLSQGSKGPDEVLVTVARTSKIIEDLTAALPARLPGSEPGQSPEVPPMLVIKALRTNLEDIRRTTSQETLENKVIMMYLLSAEALVNDIALHPVDRAASVVPGCVDFGKTECFHACLRASSQLLDTWFTFTPGELAGLPLQLHMLFARCTLILYRLSLTDDPAWDRAAIGSSVDLLAAVEKAADMYAAVPGAIGLETDGSDMYSRSGGALRGTLPIWRKALEEAGVVTGVPGNLDVAGGVGDLAAMDFSFDAWLNDSFAPFNTF